MADFKLITPAKFQSLWHANYFDKRSFITPPSKSVVWTPTVAKLDSELFAGGLTHIAFNSGAVNPNGTKSALFINNAQYIKDHSNGSKPIWEYTQTDCVEAVNEEYTHRGGNLGIVTNGASENTPSTLEWVQSFIDNGPKKAVPQQYHWLDQAWVNKLAPYGGRYYGDYDGHMNSQLQYDIDNKGFIRTILSSPEQAWNYVSTNTPYGNPFFTDNAYLYRHGLVKTYWNGSIHPARRINAIMTDILLSKRALAFKNSNKRIMSFAWPGKQEFVNRLEHYERDVPAGGKALFDGFAQYSSAMQLIIGYISLALADDIFMWEDTFRFGTDPNKVNEYEGSFAYGGFYYTGGNAIVTNNGPFPPMYQSGHNYMLSGIEFYCRASNYASGNISFAPVRILNGTYTKNSLEHIINCYTDNLPIGILHKSGTRRALFAFDINNENPGTYREYEFNLDGATYVLNMEAGMPYFIMGDISLEPIIDN